MFNSMSNSKFWCTISIRGTIFPSRVFSLRRVLPWRFQWGPRFCNLIIYEIRTKICQSLRFQLQIFNDYNSARRLKGSKILTGATRTSNIGHKPWSTSWGSNIPIGRHAPNRPQALKYFIRIKDPNRATRPKQDTGLEVLHQDQRSQYDDMPQIGHMPWSTSSESKIPIGWHAPTR
jgi:hypothetical protein